MTTSTIAIHPVTPDRWDDLERLFGPGGGYGGCWCMFFRRRSAEFSTAKATQNKADMQALVQRNEKPGLIAYINGEPAGWVSLDPREKFQKLVHSRTFKPVDDSPNVWAIVCFVIARNRRRQGLPARLLTAAIDYARSQGAAALEAYPVEPTDALKGYDGFTGIRSVFERAGFHEAARSTNGRPIMRLEL